MKWINDENPPGSNLNLKQLAPQRTVTIKKAKRSFGDLKIPKGFSFSTTRKATVNIQFGPDAAKTYKSFGIEVRHLDGALVHKGGVRILPNKNNYDLALLLPLHVRDVDLTLFLGGKKQTMRGTVDGGNTIRFVVSNNGKEVGQ